jgi:hypothetical protein
VTELKEIQMVAKRSPIYRGKVTNMKYFENNKKKEAVEEKKVSRAQ